MKSVIVAASLFIAALMIILPAWAGTLRDDFEDGNADGWRKLKGSAGGASLDQSAQWSVENGELIHISQNVCAWASGYAIGDNTWKDYEFEFQFRIEKRLPTCWKPLIGFGIRYDTPGGIINGVDIVVFANGDIFDEASGEWFFGGAAPFVMLKPVRIEMGNWYTAKAVVKGDRYQMFINDQLLWDKKYDRIKAGTAVLFGKNCEIHFDNVVITGNDVPDNNSKAVVSSPGKLTMSWGQIRSQ